MLIYCDLWTKSSKIEQQARLLLATLQYVEVFLVQATHGTKCTTCLDPTGGTGDTIPDLCQVQKQSFEDKQWSVM